MEEILVKEFELDKQLQKLELKHQKLREKSRSVKLTEMRKPQDVGQIAENRRLAAIKRNAELLKDLDMTAGKLHTKSLCPIESKLKDMKQKFFHDIQAEDSV